MIPLSSTSGLVVDRPYFFKKLSRRTKNDDAGPLPIPILNKPQSGSGLPSYLVKYLNKRQQPAKVEDEKEDGEVSPQKIVADSYEVAKASLPLSSFSPRPVENLRTGMPLQPNSCPPLLDMYSRRSKERIERLKQLELSQQQGALLRQELDNQKAVKVANQQVVKLVNRDLKKCFGDQYGEITIDRKGYLDFSGIKDVDLPPVSLEESLVRRVRRPLHIADPEFTKRLMDFLAGVCYKALLVCEPIEVKGRSLLKDSLFLASQVDPKLRDQGRGEHINKKETYIAMTFAIGNGNFELMAAIARGLYMYKKLVSSDQMLVKSADYLMGLGQLDMARKALRFVSTKSRHSQDASRLIAQIIQLKSQVDF
jgi:hypothetical protein